MWLKPYDKASHVIPGPTWVVPKKLSLEEISYCPFLTQCKESFVVCLIALTHAMELKFVIALVHEQKVYFPITSKD